MQCGYVGMQCVLAVCVCSVQWVCVQCVWPGACVGYIYIYSYITCMRCETAKGITFKKAERRSLQSCSHAVSIDPIIWRDFDATI
jgi:hypothetical protein